MLYIIQYYNIYLTLQNFLKKILIYHIHHFQFYITLVTYIKVEIAKTSSHLNFFLISLKNFIGLIQKRK